MKLNDPRGVIEVVEGRAEDIDLPVQVDIIIRHTIPIIHQLPQFKHHSRMGTVPYLPYAVPGSVVCSKLFLGWGKEIFKR